MGVLIRKGISMENKNESQILIEEEIESVEDSDCDPRNFSQAVVWGTDWTTETINSQLVKGNIDLNPNFQRRDAWSDAEKSRLIESLMLGIPVPPIILAENKNKKNSYIVIDGKQRLLSIRRFFVESSEDAFTPLKLKSLKILSELNGCTASNVRERNNDYMTSIENQSIRTIIIKNWPDEPFLYTVFLRLNTGSKKLSPQELRQALKPGPFLDYLDDATANSDIIKRMLNNKFADTRMKDIELSLRFYAYHYYFNDYTGNLKIFLDETCERLNSEWNEREREIKDVFLLLEQTIEFCYEVMGSKSPFSRYESGVSTNRFNRSIYELFTFYFCDEKIRDMVRENRELFMSLFITMNDDPEFVNAVSGSTKEIGNLILRFTKFFDLLSSLTHDGEVQIPKINLAEGKITILSIPC